MLKAILLPTSTTMGRMHNNRQVGKHMSYISVSADSRTLIFLSHTLSLLSHSFFPQPSFFYDQDLVQVRLSIPVEYFL